MIYFECYIKMGVPHWNLQNYQFYLFYYFKHSTNLLLLLLLKFVLLCGDALQYLVVIGLLQLLNNWLRLQVLKRKSLLGRHYLHLSFLRGLHCCLWNAWSLFVKNLKISRMHFFCKYFMISFYSEKWYYKFTIVL